MTFPLTGTGIWSSGLRYGDRLEAAAAVAELETLGYTAVWLPDVGGDLFGALDSVLAATETLVVATGILNLWMHEPEVTAARVHDFVERYGDRVLVGIGISHAPLIDASEAGRYRRPLATTREYLQAIDAQPNPVPVDRRVLAALGPKMLELAGTLASGTHPYLVTPEHTAVARRALGPDRLVAPEQAVVLDSDPVRARAVAREFLAGYLGLPNYSNNWMRIGFTPDDLRNGGSDRLVDALVVWGDEAAIEARVQEHRDAGADHVCLQVLTDGRLDIPVEQWRRLAPKNPVEGHW